MINKIKSEIKSIKWLDTKTVIKQTIYILLTTCIIGCLTLAFDTGIQYLLSYVF